MVFNGTAAHTQCRLYVQNPHVGGTILARASRNTFVRSFVFEFLGPCKFRKKFLKLCALLTCNHATLQVAAEVAGLL